MVQLTEAVRITEVKYPKEEGGSFGYFIIVVARQPCQKMHLTLQK